MPKSINLIPLWLGELRKSPTARVGFLGLYVRGAQFRVVRPDVGEQDLVLDRTLEGLRRLDKKLARAPGVADSVRGAIELLQAQLDRLSVLTAAQLLPLLEAGPGIYLSLTTHNTVLITTQLPAKTKGYVEPGYVQAGYVTSATTL